MSDLASCVNLDYTLSMKNSMHLPLGRLLLDAFKWFDESLLCSLREHGWPPISHSQSMVMAYLDHDGIRISELARRLGISRQAAQKRVSELERVRLVETAVDATNLSAKIVVLTPQGQAIVADALMTFSKIEQQLSKRIGGSTVENMRMALEKGWGEPIIVKERA